MTYIYKSSTVSLKKAGGNWDLTVEWEGKMKKFWINFPFPLLKIIDQKMEGDVKKKFTIKASSIKTLESFLKENGGKIGYDDSLTMLYDLGNQMQALERFYLGIPFFSIADIIVVNDKHFFYLNDEKVYNFGNSKEMVIDQLHTKSPFISPEISKINQIPMKINFKSGFYSLAALVSYCLFAAHITPDIKVEFLAPIYTTPLYWALIRMLVDDPQERYYLII